MNPIRRSPAVLALADGSVFHGESLGADGVAVGEAVFNTAMTGYQEILTDPSYARQIVCLTFPHIGNVGVNEADAESSRVHAAGLIIRECSPLASNWRMEGSFERWLMENRVVAIGGVDTRRLTRILRDRGAQAACIIAGERADAEAAIEAARAFPGLLGLDLAREVSCRQPYPWTEGGLDFDTGAFGRGVGTHHVVVYDFGVKRNILRMLVDRGCRVTVVPAQTPASEVLKLAPDGVLLSNGPGDPEPCEYAIAATRALLAQGVPLFGICLGHQILGLALGARTLKMKFGHHGANHPVLELDTGRVLITSQNHGFAVDEASLPEGVRVTHRSLFDGSLQGFACERVPAFGFQGHPEASPGPHDLHHLFDRFLAAMRVRRAADLSSESIR
ncbi:MAG: carbamoyl-phosphate synthase small chain [Lysobacterales bacterium]|jgi:carbamoyl-phosphate synthase small subunit|nr:MAG: carbamoyl-phosphate synthase small chain [Xanthomonadales bacterium]